MEKSLLVLGLDLGTTSVGWALVRHRPGRIDLETGEELKRGEGKIIGMGVRIFPETLDSKSLEPLNKKRRQARLMRRQTRRRQQRRKRLTDILVDAELLPPYGSKEWACLMKSDPYALRAQALETPLKPFELGRALYHLEKRRGFRERSHGEEEEKDTSTQKQDTDGEDIGAVRKDIETLEKKMGDRSLGQHLAHLTSRRTSWPVKPGDKSPDPIRLRGRWLGRKMVEAEFDSIVGKQKDYHPAVLTNELVDELRDLIFFQRPTFWRESTLGKCDLEPGAALSLKGDWETQQSIVLQTINALRLWGGNQRPLAKDEREAVLSVAMRQRKVTFGGVRRALKPIWKDQGIDLRTKFTHERDGRKDIPGNATEAMLREIFGGAWDGLPMRDRIRREIAERLWQADYRSVGKSPNRRFEIGGTATQNKNRNELSNQFVSDYALTKEQADELANLRLPSGWARHSRKAFERLRPHLEDGLTYMEARGRAYPDAGLRTGKGLPLLPSGPKYLPDTRNPAVVRSLNELRKVVNNIIRTYGKPDRIRIELARDLKIPRNKRRKISNEIKKNEESRKKAREELESKGVNPSRENVQKLLLWKESDEYCPYTGRKIGFDNLFGTTKVDIEHIVPRSRSHDNRMANKTICWSEFNKEKGNRTPYEYLGGNDEKWSEFVNRVNSLKNMPKAKKKRLTVEQTGPLRSRDGTALDGAERALRDSSFIARAARDFLLRLYPKVVGRADPVEPVSSRVTVELRRRWGLINLVGKKAKGDVKSRDDHRHHAVDALTVALADVRFTQTLSRWFALDRQGRRPVYPIPWLDLRADAQASLDRIVVSHRVRRKISGPLHEETILRDTGEERQGTARKLRRYVTRIEVKELTLNMLESGQGTIRDERIRKILKQHLDQVGGDKKKAFNDPDNPPVLSTPSGPRPIRRVRIVKEQDPDLMVPLDRRTQSYAKAGDTHHMAIYRKPDGKATFDTVSRFEAMRRHRAKEPIVRRNPGDDLVFVMVLYPGDTIAFPREDDRFDYRIVRSLWSSGQIVLFAHTVADGTVWGRIRPNVLLKLKARKIAVDPIGSIRQARD